MERLAKLVIAAGALTTAMITNASAPSISERDGTVYLVTGSQGWRPGERVPFNIIGKDVKGLYPGSTRMMKIVVTNPYSFDLNIRDVEGSVVATSNRHCRVKTAHLKVKEFRGSLPVKVKAYRSSEIGQLPIAMPKDTVEACAGTRFTILLSGIATKVR